MTPSQLRALYSELRASEADGSRNVDLRRRYNAALREAQDIAVHLERIHPNLWLGGARAAEREGANRVCVASARTCGYCRDNRDDQGRACEVVDAHDTTEQTMEDVVRFTDRGADAIERAVRRGKFVLHCAQGINRSVASIVAYAKRVGWDANEAAAYIADRSARVRGRPALTNRLFRRALGVSL